MTRIPLRSRRSAVVVSAVLLLLFAGLGLQTASASRRAPAVPPPPAQPTSADQIQNIDQVKTAIKAYYGDTVSGTNPDGSAQHLPSPSSAYAREVRGIERTALAYLRHRDGRSHGGHARKAIVLDVDDTSLNTYNYEIFSNFVYTPASNATFVNSAAFPAVFGMPELVRRAQRRGYTVFFLTGRPETQRAGTVTNLQNADFPAVPSSRLYLKDLTQPWITCDTRGDKVCSTIEYKSETRRRIESQGYDIVASFGDQLSDLKGGYADRRFKLPNPMYYLP